MEEEKEEVVFSLTHFGVVESHKRTDEQPVESDKSGIVTLQHCNNGTLRQCNVCLAFESRLKDADSRRSFQTANVKCV